MKTFMVQMLDRQWTTEAMHLASAMARSVDGRIVLLRLVLANNPGLLGWGIASPSVEEQRQIEDFTSIAEDYGVECCVQPMQFVSSVNALAQAVDMLDVSVLFARIPQSSIPFWRHFQVWSLKRQLRGCRLYTLDEEQPLSLEEAGLSTAM